MTATRAQVEAAHTRTDGRPPRVAARSTRRQAPLGPPLLVAVALAGCGRPPAARSAPPASRDDDYRVVAERPCLAARLTCVTLSVPRDHFAPGGPRWDVTYAIRRARARRLGTLLTIAGGPGASGIDAAEDLVDGLPAAIARHHDLVFVDLRGTGRSRPMRCPEAEARYGARAQDPLSPGRSRAVAAAARSYVRDCVAEARTDVGDLRFYATAQAAQDLEAVRRHLGAPRLNVYGESYGTQVAQIYAAHHPDAVATLVLDGAVDLVADGVSFALEQSRAFEDALAATLRHCDAQPACRRDTGGGSAERAYERLRARLARGPTRFRFVRGDGAAVERSFTAEDLDAAVTGALELPIGRQLLQRAIAAASHDELGELARLAYDGMQIDPDTLAVRSDAAMSDATYYAVECQDYPYYQGLGDPTARFTAWVRIGRRAGLEGERMAARMFTDVPCLWWPSQPGAGLHAAPVARAGFPTLLPAATMDPVTPPGNALRIFQRATDGYLVLRGGGSHVTFGRGDPCPDRLVSALLLEGKRPATRISLCPGTLAPAYVAHARARLRDYPDALGFMRSMEQQILDTVDFRLRLDRQPIVVGCARGGVIEYSPMAHATRLRLLGCAFVPDAAMTGDGRIDERGGVRLSVALPRGAVLRYVRPGGGVPRVTGRLHGRHGPTRRGAG